MSKRKMHHKSRFGCSNCKKRKVKCDDNQPTCKNCERLGFDCGFRLLAASTPLSTTTTVTPTSGAEDLTPSTSSTQCEEPHILASGRIATEIELRNKQDLAPCIQFNDIWRAFRVKLHPSLQKVLHHYRHSTSLTMATEPPAQSAWQNYIPEHGSQHPFLVAFMLSIASLHLAQLNGDSRQKTSLMTIATSQIDKGLASYRIQLGNINGENATAIFASATLIMAFIFRTSTMEIEELREELSAEKLSPPSDVIDRMLRCVTKMFWGLRGAATVLCPTRSWITQASEMRPVVTRHWWPPHLNPVGARAFDEDRKLCLLQELLLDSRNEDKNRTRILRHAFDKLRICFARVSQLIIPYPEYTSMNTIPYAFDDISVGFLKDRGAILMWLTQVDQEFITLVEARDREALVLMAHWALLLARVRSVWWIKDTGAHMIIAIAAALERQSWQLIEWPLREAGLDLENILMALKCRYN